ncbi:PAS domain S-box protein [Ulvibacter litoralis]|uniref:histidine kinase n=1 Tax=Ulvibacter litoralis TaxID=227084 RepID=A0A1G7EWB1_9FLAO|nr:PAS domain S-box protein [Ulvibacter litoralis]GHC53656.1 hypothetical protein GCM10008083_17180 [Ulvibacter litoralis]SDE67937.1 PAS domain S-box-containing protein [Ulvibacter litoralis]
MKDQALFQSVFESSVEGILVADSKGTIIKSNPACDRIFGYSKGEMIGLAVDDLVPHNFRKKHKKHRTNFAKKPTHRAMGAGIVLQGQKKDGSKFPAEISLNPTSIDGVPVIISFIFDITKRIQATQASIANTQRMNEAQRLSHIGSWSWNLTTNERNWSDEFYRICGLIPGDPQLRSETAINFIHPDDRERTKKAVATAIKEKLPYSFEKRILRPDNTIRFVHAKGKFEYDQEDRPVLMIGTIQDITDSKETKEKLVHSETRTKAILKALPDILYVFNEEGFFLDAHSKKSFLQPIPQEELIGKNMYDVLPKKLCDKLAKAFSTTKNTQETQIIEYSHATTNVLKYIEARVLVKENGNFLTIVRDITQAKENKLHIKKSEERFRLSMLATHDGFYDFNLKTNKGWYSQRYIDLFNPTDRKNWWKDNIHPADKETVLKTIEHALRSNKNYWTSEYRLKRDATTYAYVEDRGYIVRDKTGEAVRVLGAIADITKQKKEEILKDDVRDILELIIHNSPIDSIGYKIVETVENHIDACITSMLLLNPNTNNLHKLVAPNLPKAFSKNIETVPVGHTSGSCGTAAFIKKEVIVSAIENDPLWHDYKDIALENGLKSCWSFPIISSSEKVLGTFAIYSDKPRKPTTFERGIITDMVQLASVAIEQNNAKTTLLENKKQLKKYAEGLEAKVDERTHELKVTIQQLVESNISLEDQINITKTAENRALESQLMFSTIAENFPKGFVAIVDSDYKIVFLKGEELEGLGFSNLATEIKSIDDAKAVPARVRNKVKKNIEETLLGQHCSFEIHFKNQSYLVNTTPLINQDKNTVQALLVHNNISDQKEIEREIQNALRKEKELNELKSLFITTASHEFRTPLSVILSSASLIKRQKDLGNEEKIEKYLERIKSNVRNLVVILNDFLSLSKLEEGKVTAKLESFSVIPFLKSIIKDIHPNKKRGQKIILIENTSELKVNLDPKLLRHILINLLSNAIKYSSENKEITFTISRQEEEICLDVVDRGIGIIKEEQKNIFQRFFRAGNAINIQGTGLGLNIVKQYTELMGGTISFESEVNKGSSFNVKLPINANTAKNEKNTDY